MYYVFLNISVHLYLHLVTTFTALKHVKWLKQLQEERRLLDENIKEAEQKQQEERNKLFMEREAKKRASGKISNTVDESKRHTAAPSTPETDDSTVASSIASSKSDNTKRKKPAWCQSEAARDEAEELNELDDEVNLLDFVSGLQLLCLSTDVTFKPCLCLEQYVCPSYVAITCR